MEALTLNIPPNFNLTDEQFYQLCLANEAWTIELTATGELIIMPPTGGESGIRNADLNFQIVSWNRQTQLGYVFDSSTVFKLPNGAKRSPDLAWIKQERWNHLSTEDKRRFPPICPDFVIKLRSETDNLEPLRSKLLEYLENGIQLGWLIDPKTKQVEIYRPNQAVEIIDFSNTQNPLTLSGESVLPGLVIDLEPIFRRY
jgi:Uma2 family endonuclease